ncbi:hypothetical protein JMJ35_003952 [Cladonia borealis]|uniref:Uncharacterized protein n=1 Tax=Cladonia borealis TaxID=184061 RepID=A0AA39R2B5_9LECA|nr:hypothetical protein JMJ35_003952 [Cladonia borealis]
MLSVGMTGDSGSDGDVGKRDVGGSEVEGEVLVPVVGRGEAKDLWRRRNAVVPVYVGGVEVEGRVDGNVRLGAVDAAALRTLLTPIITLSSTTTNNTTLTITLSTNSTSFLTGLFAFPNSTAKSSEASILAAAGFKEEYVLPGTSMVGFPTSLVVTCIWTVLCLSVQGCGVWRKWRAREEYRWRVRGRVGGGGGGWCGA